jgi:hypothetical protein
MIHIDISGTASSLLLSEYGERMQWSCPIPGMDFDPGDGHPIVLRINCLNSVDTSTVLVEKKCAATLSSEVLSCLRRRNGK